MAICENLKLLGVSEPQEKLKRETLDRYINLYAELQAKKTFNLSGARQRLTQEYQSNDKDSSIGRQQQEFSEIRHFK